MAKSKNKLHKMEIEHAENGGHVITHHMPMKRSGQAFMERPEPEVHAFGPDQHEEAMAHIAEHMGMGGDKEIEGEEEEA